MQQQQKYPQEEQQQQQQLQMGFNGDGGGGGGGGESNNNNNNNRGGGGGGGGGLTRFWSAPSTWLDSLVQDLEIPASQNHCLSQLPTSTAAPPPPLLRSSNFFDTTNNSSGAGTLLSTSSDLGFPRQNSSPAELLDHLTSSQVLGSDGYLPSFGGEFNYNLSSSSSLDFPTNKRTRESEFHQDPSKFSTQLKGEPLSGVNSFSDMEMEKLFEDSVPCRVRAKRGCATHPRSIAERVRRTRISDRIRKLQELVPNMDKQTNTADMLEEAVEYVKVLQKQIKELSEHQQNCTCLARS